MIPTVLGDHPGLVALLEEASDVLHRDIAAEVAPGNTKLFESNQSIQLSVFLATQLHLVALRAAGIEGDLSLGMSLGEYSHIVHIGGLAFADAVRLVDARGVAYDRGPSGIMVSIFPADQADIERAIVDTDSVGEVVISNFNSPAQFVIAGEEVAVRRVATALEEDNFLHTAVIERQIPMHSPRFRPVAGDLRVQLERSAWRSVKIPYWPNVTGDEIVDPTRDDFIDCLSAHVHQPVQWRRSIDKMAESHPDCVFVEVGPKTALCDLMRKSWKRNQRLATDAMSVDEIAERLSDRFELAHEG